MKTATKFAEEGIRLHIDAHSIPMHRKDASAPSAGVPTDDGCLENSRTFKEAYKGGNKIAHRYPLSLR